MKNNNLSLLLSKYKISVGKVQLDDSIKYYQNNIFIIIYHFIIKITVSIMNL